jgi:hypothetical protein
MFFTYGVFLHTVCFYIRRVLHTVCFYIRYFFSNPTGPFCTHVSKNVSNACSAKTYYINRLTHKNCKRQWRTEGGRGVWGIQSPPPPKCRRLEKAGPNSSSVGNTPVTTLDVPKVWQSRTGLQIERNPWLGGYRPPDPRSLCPLSSPEFVEPPHPNKIPGYANGKRVTTSNPTAQPTD